MGFIGYRREPSEAGDLVRIYLECQEELVPADEHDGSQTGLSCSYAVDVIFPGGGAPCRLSGVEDILALKKFYKLVFSLEERAREHGHPFRAVFASPAALLEHLAYTHNARLLENGQEPQRRLRSREETLHELAELECSAGEFRNIA